MDQSQISFIELRASGCSLSKISNEIGVSKPTLIKWLKKFENEIENAKSIEIESIKEKFNVSRHETLLKLIEFQSRALNELLMRDLKDISTDKLVKIVLEMNEKISNIKVKTESDVLHDLDYNFKSIEL